MRNQEILLRWQYTNGQPYEFHSKDSVQVGQLYRLKVLENEVAKVEVMLGDVVVISWTKQED